MNIIPRAFLNFHPLVTLLIIGTMMARMATSMSIPFLAIYLSSKGNIDPWFIGVILGAGPLAGTFAGFLGGALSDRLGRKRIMLASLYLYSLVFVSFAFSQDPWVFMMLSILNGACRAFFEPTAQALMGDLTPSDQRYRVFSVRYMAANAGVAIGPMIGVLFGFTAGFEPFIITGLFHFIYAITLHWLMGRLTISGSEDSYGEKTNVSKETITISNALRVVLKDRVLLYYLLGGLVIQIVYAQMTTTLPHLLTDKMANGAELFAWLMTTNAIVVVLFQVPISNAAEKRVPMWSIRWGNLLYGIGGIGFALSDNWVGMILSMVIFTLGEVMSFPAGTILVDRIAPDGLRGAYYGSQNFRELGRFAGPPLGFMIVDAYGAIPLFSIMLLFALLSVRDL